MTQDQERAGIEGTPPAPPAAGAPAGEPTTDDATAAGSARAADIVVRLPDFEGPLDLLLHLIEREDLDVTTVSLVQVTEQYLRQLRSTGSINLAALADFVAVGARLLLLKSRALLPREERPDEPADDESDPEALVAALREYRRYKRAAEHLRSLEEEHRTAYRREAPPPEVPLPTGLGGVTLDALVDLFRDVLERLPEEEPQPTVRREPVRLHDRIQRLVSRLEGTGRISFRELVGEARSRVEVVVDFLAILELIKAGYLHATQSDTFADINLVRSSDAAAPSLESIASELDADFAT